MRDQAAVEMERRDEWRKTLDREIQLNTMQIDQMKHAADQGLGFGLAAPLLQFIGREGWRIGYAATGHVINRWNSLREWVEDYPDNGGLNTTLEKLVPYIVQSEVKIADVQHQAIKAVFRSIEPVDRKVLRPQAMKIAEVVGDEDLVTLIHDESRVSEGGNGSNQYKSNARPMPHVASRTDPRRNTQAGRLQLRDYAADPKRCERYGKDHKLCEEAWIKHERGEMSLTEAQIHCGLRKKEPARVFYATKDLEAFVQRIKAVFPADACQAIARLLLESAND